MENRVSEFEGFIRQKYGDVAWVQIMLDSPHEMQAIFCSGNHRGSAVQRLVSITSESLELEKNELWAEFEESMNPVA